MAVGVKSAPGDAAHYFQTGELALDIGDYCIVPAEDRGGERVGYVVCFEGRPAEHYAALPGVIRLARDEEMEWLHIQLQRAQQAMIQARAKVQQHQLPMKLVSVRFDDASNIVHFDFTADHRVDFRHLVRDLAGTFKARIELWQIGPREGSARKDGFGQCGQRLCCASWMKSYPTVSVRQARDQDINQAPPQMTGTCGRLRCCLRYEHEAYCELAKGAPLMGSQVKDDREREGIVADRNLITRRALVRYEKIPSEWLPFDKLHVLRAASQAAAATDEAEDLN
jgi:cell fate regulator YaaT (PSP1 superfamily)